jgi:hypothetical protein
MKKSLLWVLAVLLTLVSAVYQRVTGPTYDFRAKAAVDGSELRFRLPRSAENSEDCRIVLSVPQPVEGTLEYKRYKTDDAWTQVPFLREGDDLTVSLPRQPAAGKLAYRVFLASGTVLTPLSGEDPIVIRFKDPVPLWLIILHVIVIFGGMLLSTRAGLAALDKSDNPRRFIGVTLAFLIAGGFILGPLVQKYAFGVLWSGFPFGTDLTDNKALVSLAFWVAAAVAARKGKEARGWVLAASFVTLVIYLIPHSLLGSELDYSKM